MDDMPDQGLMQEVGIDSVSLSMVGAHLIFTEIDQVSAQRAVEFLLKSNMTLQDGFPLTLFLNTPGGECSMGHAIISVMEMSRLPISTVGIGEVASMGVSILAAGTKGLRFATDSTIIMTHQYSAGFSGKHHELIASRVVQDRLHDMFVTHYRRHTKMTVAQIKDVLLGPSDKYLTPAECVKYGIIDHIKSPWQLEDETAAKKPARKKKEIVIEGGAGDPA